MDRKKYTYLTQAALILASIFCLAACNGNHDYSPKPRGYFRIIFPKKQYRAYDEACPFTFVYPTYARIEPDTKPDAKPCWLNMQFPQFGGTLHLSYEHINSQKEFDALVEDAHKLTFEHTVKATSIDQGVISYPDRKVYGIYFSVDGNAASSVQFYLTDSTKNYIRGALYFYTEPRLDSIQPVLTFVKQDVNLMIKSFRWK